MHHHHHTGHRILWAMPPISWRMSTASSSLFMNEIRIKWHLNEKSKKVTFLTLNYCKLLYVHSSCLTIIITLFLSLISLNVLISSVMYKGNWKEKNFLLVMLFRLYIVYISAHGYDPMFSYVYINHWWWINIMNMYPLDVLVENKAFDLIWFDLIWFCFL
jgi:hypothetical protein